MELLARLGVQKKRGYTNAKSIAKKKLLLLWIGIACRS
jgi:hypothetical protein